jgi:uridine phosphorylase
VTTPSHGIARAASNGHGASPDYPLLQSKAYDEPSVFQPASLLREARRQKAMPDVPVPAVCVLDPDGDIVRWLKTTGHGRQHPGWACYHTEMWSTEVDGLELGIVGMAVGAPFAVLVAEQLAASGADLVISVTSAGQITQLAEPPYFVLIERAWRDEGTSVHYRPPSPWSELNEATARAVRAVTTDGRTAPDRESRQDADPLPGGEPILCGSSWTTDAPYRETSTAIAAAATQGIACVEMEAAALYAYATATGRTVVCLAHVTNTMAVDGDDFEKGAAGGALAALQVVRAVASAVTAGVVGRDLGRPAVGGRSADA